MKVYMWMGACRERIDMVKVMKGRCGHGEEKEKSKQVKKLLIHMAFHHPLSSFLLLSFPNIKTIL